MLHVESIADGPGTSDRFAAVAAALLREGMRVRFRAHGRSMRPLIHDGDELVLEPCAPEDVRAGTVLFHLNAAGRPTAHRVLRVTRGRGGLTFLLRGDAAVAVCEEVGPSQVLGRAVTRIRGEREQRLNTPWRRLVGLAWACLQSARSWTARALGRVGRKAKRAQR